MFSWKYTKNHKKSSWYDHWPLKAAEKDAKARATEGKEACVGGWRWGRGGQRLNELPIEEWRSRYSLGILREGDKRREAVAVTRF